jgi:RNA polymerase sigma factor (sigma-70 family)
MAMTVGSITLDQLVGETVWLRKLAGSLVADQGDDAVQDTLLVASVHAPTDRPVGPWLYRALVNRIRVVTRGESRRKKREEAAGELATAPARPDEIVERIELHRRLAGYVLALPQGERDVVLLHYFEGLTSIAIGNRLGISAGTVRWRLKQAVDELRRQLDAESPNRAWLAPMLGLAKGTGVAAGVSIVVLVALALAIVFAILAIPRIGDVAFTPGGGDDTAVPTERMVAAVTPLATESGKAPRPYVPLEERKLTGRVVDQTGKPVAGAEVVLHCSFFDTGAEKTKITGSDGTFAFDTDMQCDLNLTASKDTASATTREMFERGQDRPIELKLVPAATWVLHVVDAKTGAPIANAHVVSHAFLAAGDRATSDAAGVARIHWLDKLTFASVEVPGYVSTRIVHKSETPPTADIERTVRLERGVVISGVVLDPDGRPVGGAYAHAVDGANNFYGTQADDNGAFAITVPTAGRYAVSADHPDFVDSKPLDTAVGAEGRSDLTFALARGAEIAGTVVDLAGKPVVGARVYTWRDNRRPVVTDERGRFELHNATDEYLIAQRGPLASEWKHVTVAVGERAQVELPIGPSGIAGIVVDPKGKPVANADVWLNYCCEPGPVLVSGTRAMTDDQGRFGIETPRGTFTLSMRRDRDDDFDDADDVRVQGGSRDVRLVLP